MSALIWRLGWLDISTVNAIESALDRRVCSMSETQFLKLASGRDLKNAQQFYILPKMLSDYRPVRKESSAKQEEESLETKKSKKNWPLVSLENNKYRIYIICRVSFIHLLLSTRYAFYLWIKNEWF